MKKRSMSGWGDGEGASRGDLALEHGDDAAVRAQHVAEAHGGEHGLGRARVQLHHHLAMRFVAPMTLVGFTALSVEMKMKRAAP